jgi:hypothetical protein
MRMNEVTEAVLDRFTYKAIMPEKSDVYTQLLIDDTYSATRGKPLEPEKKIYFNQIQYLYDIIANNNDSVKVNVPDYIYFMKNVIVNKFVDEMRKSDKDYFISPRKQAKIADFLRASALLDNRFEATMDDLKELHLALCTLNSYVTVKSVHKLERDIYLDAYQQTMVHYNATGASEQVEFLLGVRKLFQEIRHDPDKREVLLQKKGIMDSFMGLLYKLFPRSKDEKEKPTIETLKKSIVQLDPALEEVRELKEGILKDYRDVY